MLFAKTWEKVLSGEKCQTRRLVMPRTVDPFEVAKMAHYPYYPTEDANTDGDWLHNSAVWNAKPCDWGKGYMGLPYTKARTRFAVGQTLAVQPGRGKSALARIRITDIARDSDVRQISYEDVKAEGFAATPEGKWDFLQLWCKLHDPAFVFWFEPWITDYMWYVKPFRKSTVPDCGGYIELLEAMGKRPAERYTAWKLTFELVKAAGD